VSDLGKWGRPPPELPPGVDLDRLLGRHVAPLEIGALTRQGRRSLRRHTVTRLGDLRLFDDDGALIVGPYASGPPPWHIRLDVADVAVLANALCRHLMAGAPTTEKGPDR